MFNSSSIIALAGNGRALRWWGNQGSNVQFLNKSLIKAQMLNFARHPHYCKTDVTCRLFVNYEQKT